MAEYGEWNRKGATLSDITAKKEYGVDRDFIVKGIRAGKLEYRPEHPITIANLHPGGYADNRNEGTQ